MLISPKGMESMSTSIQALIVFLGNGLGITIFQVVYCFNLPVVKTPDIIMTGTLRAMVLGFLFSLVALIFNVMIKKPANNEANFKSFEIA